MKNSKWLLELGACFVSLHLKWDVDTPSLFFPLPVRFYWEMFLYRVSILYEHIKQIRLLLPVQSLRIGRDRTYILSLLQELLGFALPYLHKENEMEFNDRVITNNSYYTLQNWKLSPPINKRDFPLTFQSNDFNAGIPTQQMIHEIYGSVVTTIQCFQLPKSTTFDSKWSQQVYRIWDSIEMRESE